MMAVVCLRKDSTDHFAVDPPAHLSQTLLPRPHAAGHDPGATHATAASSACCCLRRCTLPLPLAVRLLGGPPLLVRSQALGGVISQVLVMVLQPRRFRPVDVDTTSQHICASSRQGTERGIRTQGCDSSKDICGPARAQQHCVRGHLDPDNPQATSRRRAPLIHICS